jgi:aspartyl protease family protein
MTSPLNFALGTAALCCLAAAVLSDRLATLLPAPGGAGSAQIAAPDNRAGASDTTANAATLSADRHGHFRAPVRINGVMVDAMVDTGASMVALSYEDARHIGLNPPASAPQARANTANGQVSYTMVRLNEISIDGITVRDVEGAVMPKGALKGTLLGMSFLRKLSRFEIHDGRLALTQ